MTLIDRDSKGQTLERVDLDRTDYCNTTEPLGCGLRVLEKSGANEALESFEEHLQDKGFWDVQIQFPEPYEGTARVNAYWNFREIAVGDSKFNACSQIIVYARGDANDLMIIGQLHEGKTLPARRLKSGDVYEELLRVSERPIIHLLGEVTAK